MQQAGFTSLTCREVKQTSRVTDARPYREKAYSCLRLIDEYEFQDGLQRLDNDLREGPVEGVSEYVCLWGREAVCLE
jgi:hypothetical protein